MTEVLWTALLRYRDNTERLTLTENKVIFCAQNTEGHNFNEPLGCVAISYQPDLPCESHHSKEPHEGQPYRTGYLDPWDITLRVAL